MLVPLARLVFLSVQSLCSECGRFMALAFVPTKAVRPDCLVARQNYPALVNIQMWQRRQGAIQGCMKNNPEQTEKTAHGLGSKKR